MFRRKPSEAHECKPDNEPIPEHVAIPGFCGSCGQATGAEPIRLGKSTFCQPEFGPEVNAILQALSDSIAGLPFRSHGTGGSGFSSRGNPTHTFAEFYLPNKMLGKIEVTLTPSRGTRYCLHSQSAPAENAEAPNNASDAP